MQLSVACNLILKGVRTLTGRWIISHRRSRMAVYVLWCNAQNKSHSNHLTCIRPYSVNCPSVICLPSMLYILWRDASSELWTPVLSFTLIQTSTAILFSLLYCKHFFPLDTINPLFSANRWDWQPHYKLGQSILVVLWQVPRCCWRR